MRSACAWEIGSGMANGSVASFTLMPHASWHVPDPMRVTNTSSSLRRRSHRRKGFRMASCSAPGSGLRIAATFCCSVALSFAFASISFRCSKKRTRAVSASLRLPVRERANITSALTITITNITEPMAMRIGLPDDIIMSTMPMPPITGSRNVTAFAAAPLERIVGIWANSNGPCGTIARFARAGR